MNKVELLTREGKLVTTVSIPCFEVPAEGIMWGSRTFFYDYDHSEYREGLLYWAHSLYVEPVDAK